MSVNNHRHPFGLQHALGFLKSASHLFLKEDLRGLIVAVVPSTLLNYFSTFRGEWGSENIWIQEANTTLQPDVKEIGQIGIRYSIIIGRIANDSIKIAVRVW